MAQHDYVIDNQSAPASRADINAVLQAIVSTNSGATPPSTTFANMTWYDTANDLLKIRNEANSAWITLGTVDQTLATFSTNFTPASQVEAEEGTNNTKAMTPLRAAQAIAVLGGIGDVNLQVFTASDTYIPTAGYKRALVIATGGGKGANGGLGGGTSTKSGDGGDTVFDILDLVGMSPQVVTVGAGSLGVSAVTASNAGDTSVGSLVVARGGGRSTTNVGLFVVSGQTGGQTGAGAPAHGGGSFWGGGGIGNGANASVFGSGGAGAYSSSSVHRGGDGYSGVVFILEFK